MIPVRYHRHGLQVCLIRRKDSMKWGIPKGFIDRGDSPEEAGLNEAIEEAGVKGRIIGDAVGTFEYTKWSTSLTVAVYVMEVVEEMEHWKEQRLRERAWRSVEQATLLLARHPVRTLWDRVSKRLAALPERYR